MRLGVICKIRKNQDQTTALSLYKTLVLPHIDYCDIVYNCSTQENLNELQLLQNRACRSILLVGPVAYVADMLENLNLLYLDQRRYLLMSITCHKSVYLNGLSILSFSIYQSCKKY